jgi:hypothetical protein
VTVVGTDPPLIFTVTPDLTAPELLLIVPAIFPAVAMAMFAVVVCPPVTVTETERVRYPVWLALTVYVPAATEASVYVPVLEVVVLPPL